MLCKTVVNLWEATGSHRLGITALSPFVIQAAGIQRHISSTVEVKPQLPNPSQHCQWSGMLELQEHLVLGHFGHSQCLTIHQAWGTFGPLDMHRMQAWRQESAAWKSPESARMLPVETSEVKGLLVPVSSCNLVLQPGQRMQNIWNCSRND